MSVGGVGHRGFKLSGVGTLSTTVYVPAGGVDKERGTRSWSNPFQPVPGKKIRLV